MVRHWLLSHARTLSAKKKKKKLIGNFEKNTFRQNILKLLLKKLSLFFSSEFDKITLYSMNKKEKNKNKNKKEAK